MFVSVCQWFIFFARMKLTDFRHSIYVPVLFLSSTFQAFLVSFFLFYYLPQIAHLLFLSFLMLYLFFGFFVFFRVITFKKKE